MNIEVKTVKLSAIKLNPDNPRTISNKAMDYLVKSLQDFPEMMKLREIVVDETMTVLGGNMRLLALRKTGAKEATAKVVKGLTPEQKREFVIKDNSNFGTYDWDALANSWSDLPLTEWGVDLPEGWLSKDEDEPQDAEPQIDQAEELNKKWRVTTGDVWLIGEHRLMCGDATTKEDVSALMGEERADMVFTDPPYNVNYGASMKDAVRGNKRKIENDNLGTDFARFLFNACVNMLEVTRGAVYICMSSSELHTLQKAFRDAGGHWSTFLIWAKNTFTMGRADYQRQYEPILYGWKEGGEHHWCGARDQGDVWFVNKPRVNALHPTMKPLELCMKGIENSSLQGGLVLDPFLGSGSTMVACENLSRKCRGIELDPNYCAVILQRMTDAFPGIEIRRAE